MSCGDIFLGLIAVLFPPIAVWIKSGLCTADSLINILLCMLGYVPGLLHAWYIIAKNPEYDYEPVDEEANSRVTYYVNHEGSNAPRRGNAPPPQQRGYGTANVRGDAASTTAPPTLPGNRPQQSANGTWTATAESGSSTAPVGAPPSYADAIRGDHKVQSHD